MMVKINSSVPLLSKLCNFRLLGVSNNPCSLTKMLNVDKGVMLVNNRLRILQKQTALQIQNARFIPAFLLNNVRTALLSQNVSPAFINNARSATNARPVSQLLQNIKPAFCLY